MNRKSFLKKLVTGAAVIAATPSILAEKPVSKYVCGVDPAIHGGKVSVLRMDEFDKAQMEAIYLMRRDMERAMLFGKRDNTIKCPSMPWTWKD